MNVCVVGTGYIGLITGVRLAQLGHDVIYVNSSASEVANMQIGHSSLLAPEIKAVMQDSIQAGRLYFSTDLGAGVAHGDVIFIAVDQPSTRSEVYASDLVEATARDIGLHLSHMKRAYKVIVNATSVSFPSNTWLRQVILDEMSRQQIKQASPQEFVMIAENFDIVSHPLFLQDGGTPCEIFNSRQIVLRSTSKRAIAIIRVLYAPMINCKVSNDPAGSLIPVIVANSTAIGEKKRSASLSMLQVA